MYYLKLKNFENKNINFYFNKNNLYLLNYLSSFLNLNLRKPKIKIIFGFLKSNIKIFKNMNIMYFNFIDFYNLLFLNYYKKNLFQMKFLFFRLFKIHGINMRLVLLKKLIKFNIIYLRLAYSHGFLLYLPKIVLLKVFKKRFLLLSSFDLNYLNNLTYSLKLFKRFFKYKLIGIKLLRDNIKIKIGKKKTI